MIKKIIVNIYISFLICDLTILYKHLSSTRVLLKIIKYNRKLYQEILIDSYHQLLNSQELIWGHLHQLILQLLKSKQLKLTTHRYCIDFVIFDSPQTCLRPSSTNLNANESPYREYSMKDNVEISDNDNTYSIFLNELKYSIVFVLISINLK